MVKIIENKENLIDKIDKILYNNNKEKENNSPKLFKDITPSNNNIPW